jgi:hypothetical protein
MLTDGFGPRMLANMEIALDQACEFLPVGLEGHEGRKLVASKIRECAENGHGTVRDLTLAGRAAAIRLHGLNRAHLGPVSSQASGGLRAALRH